MRFTYEEIKKELKEHYDEINSDNLAEWAEGFCPVYYNEIIEDWKEMPSEFDNNWRDGVAVTAETTLYDLMSFDLFVYYLEKCNQALDELREEAEETANN